MRDIHEPTKDEVTALLDAVGWVLEDFEKHGEVLDQPWHAMESAWGRALGFADWEDALAARLNSGTNSGEKPDAEEPPQAIS